jgi:hypothetical protein
LVCTSLTFLLQGEEFAREHGLIFMEASPKEIKRVKAAFSDTVKEILLKIEHGAIGVNEVHDHAYVCLYA